MKEAIACWNSIERAKVLKKGYRLVCEKKIKKKNPRWTVEEGNTQRSD